MPAALALRGKGDEGDSLDGVPLDLDPATLHRFFTGEYEEAEARRLLGGATARHVYYLGEQVDAEGWLRYGQHPPCAAGLLREQHLARVPEGEMSPLQAAFEYADGGGNLLVSKAQAEPEVPGGPLRWIVTGKTILNNKGKPVKQYEPYFSPHHSWDAEEASQEVGVTPIIYYDAAGSTVRTVLPDGTFSRVEFSPWFARSFDPNDTVLESQWFRERGGDPAWNLTDGQSEPREPQPRSACPLWLVGSQQRTVGHCKIRTPEVRPMLCHASRGDARVTPHSLPEPGRVERLLHRCKGPEVHRDLWGPCLLHAKRKVIHCTILQGWWGKHVHPILRIIVGIGAEVGMQAIGDKRSPGTQILCNALAHSGQMLLGLGVVKQIDRHRQIKGAIARQRPRIRHMICQCAQRIVRFRLLGDPNHLRRQVDSHHLGGTGTPELTGIVTRTTRHIEDMAFRDAANIRKCRHDGIFFNMGAVRKLKRRIVLIG
jgi:hypothetical protein